MAYGTGDKKLTLTRRLGFALAVLLAALTALLFFSNVVWASPDGADPSSPSNHGPGSGAKNSDDNSPLLALRVPDGDSEVPVDVSLAGGRQASARFDKETGVPVFLSGAIPSSAGSSHDSAIEFFEQNKNLFRISNPGAELKQVRDTVDSLGMTHVRMSQEYNGVPVFGSEMAVHFSQSGEIVTVNGNYVPGISLDVNPQLSVDQAVAAARSELGYPAQSSTFEPPQLVIVAPTGKTVQLAWKVTLIGDNPPLREYFFIDAHSGQLAARMNVLEDAKSRKVYTASNGTSLPGTLLINEGGSSGDGVAQAAYNNIGSTYDYYSTIFGRDSFDNAGAALISTVHYGSSYNNAYWNGQQMVFGDGDGYTFSPLAGALDVVAHELTHAVTQNTANLAYSYQSGALNESYSDVFGEMAENRVRGGGNDWLMGEEVYTPGTPGDALRSLSNPPQYGQPDNMNNYVVTNSDNGGVHTNSGIPNKAAYNVATAIGRDKMQRIWYRTLSLYLNSGSQFTDARDASVQAATDLYGAGTPEVTAVINGFAAVGIGGTTTSDTTARIEINHTYRGDLVVTLGVGNPDSPTWSKVISNREGGSADNIYTTVDIAAAISYLPPDWQNRWFLKVYDAAGYDTGTLQKFAITDHGTTYTATDVPQAVTDYNTVTSYVPTTDSTPPTVTATSPVNSGLAYADTNITATFSESINAATVSSTSYKLTKQSDGTEVPAQVTYNSASKAAVLNPNVDLEYSTVYDAVLTTAIADPAGNVMAQNYTWSFTTKPAPKNYFFTWYDMKSAGMRDWVVMGNPSGVASAAAFNVYIANQLRNANPVAVAPNKTSPVSFAGVMGGPVRVKGLDGTPAIISKRTLYGDSLEEINGYEETRLDSKYYFTWYDQQSPGSRNWVLIANPGSTPVAAEIYIAGRKMRPNPYLINPGASVTPEFPGVMGGPVEVRAYEPGNPSQPRDIFATQRVLWNGNFNEVVGIPASELTSDYLFTWYDQKSRGARNWVLISNPNSTQSLAVEITVAGQKMINRANGAQYFTIAPGKSVTPTFPGVLNGPVEIRGYNAATFNPANPGTPDMNFYTTQRSLFGDSFEEVAGFSVNRLTSQYYFSWYDQRSAGSSNWVLVSNPGSSTIIAEIWIAGQKFKVLPIAPGQTLTPTFPGIMSGPVEVRGYNAATYNPVNPGSPNSLVFTSQRVMWKNHFNEVEGIVPN